MAVVMYVSIPNGLVYFSVGDYASNSEKCILCFYYAYGCGYVRSISIWVDVFLRGGLEFWGIPMSVTISHCPEFQLNCSL